MSGAETKLLGNLTREPCVRCERQSAFLADEGLCPRCRTDDLERDHGLRPGLLRALPEAAPRAPRTRPRARRKPARRARVLA